jgi:cytochrome c-type biogenesis protein CcmH
VRLALALLLLCVPAAGYADSSLPQATYADTQLPNPAQEAAARNLMDSIRCLVCEGQSIADSNAEMAGDMRALIRGRVAAGESPESIKSWLIERYGTGITYDPPLDTETALLWLTPLFLLSLGGLLLRGRIKGRRP